MPGHASSNSTSGWLMKRTAIKPTAARKLAPTTAGSLTNPAPATSRHAKKTSQAANVRAPASLITAPTSVRKHKYPPQLQSDPASSDEEPLIEATPPPSKKKKVAELRPSETRQADTLEQAPRIHKEALPKPPSPQTEDEGNPALDAQKLIQLIPVIDARANFLTRHNLGYEQLHLRARLMPRVLGAFIKVEKAFTEGGALAASHHDYLSTRRPGETWDHDIDMYRSYKQLKVYFPTLLEIEDHLLANPEHAVKLLDFIDKTAGRARSDDLARLCQRILKVFDTGTSGLEGLRIKTKRGFKNTFTGRLLCPITKLAEFDQDPRGFCRAVRNGEIQIKSRDWPVFIYDKHLIKPGKVRPGLLRSPQLIKLFQLLYLGPSAGDAELEEANKTTGKASIAAKYGITAVTAESICYVIALARSLLSSRNKWSISDGHYNGPDFIRSIQRIFVRYPRWSDELLDWWDQQVFGSSWEDDDGEATAADLMDLESDEDEDEGCRYHITKGFEGEDDGEHDPEGFYPALNELGRDHPTPLQPGDQDDEDDAEARFETEADNAVNGVNVDEVAARPPSSGPENVPRGRNVKHEDGGEAGHTEKED